MIFDGHCDIWTDVTIKRNKGMENILNNFHLERFKKGNLMGGIFVIWIDPPYEEEPRHRTLEMLENMAIELVKSQDNFRPVKTYEDFDLSLEDGKIAIVLGLEGLGYIGEDIELIKFLYYLGIRHASLTWNEENALATGAGGSKDRGLTDLGLKAVRLMEDLGMIIDVSHLNDKSFYHILDNTSKPIIASHSNVRKLCHHPRNLTDEQIKLIGERNGLIGINTYHHFVHKDVDKQNLENLLNHLDYIVDLIGIDHIGFGFDFFDYLDGESTSSFSSGKVLETKGIENITKANNIIEALKARSYSQEDIEKISYKNFQRIIKAIL